MQCNSYFVLSLLFLLNSFCLNAQFRATTSSADTFAFVRLTLYNPDGSFYNGDVLLTGQKPGHEVLVKTNAKGYVRAEVPISDEYTVQCGPHTCYKKAKVGDFPYVTSTFQAYTHRFIYLKFLGTSPQGNPLKNEEVIVSSWQTGQTYKDSSDQNGLAEFFLPYEYRFNINLKYYSTNVQTTDNKKSYKQITVRATTRSSYEIERSIFVRDSIRRAQDSIALAQKEALLDTLTMLGNAKDCQEFKKFNIPILYRYKDYYLGDYDDWTYKFLEQKAKSYRALLDKDPDFFETCYDPLFTPLGGIQRYLKDAIIVMDYSYDMMSFEKEFRLFQQINLQKKRRPDYIFFTNESRQCGAYPETMDIGDLGGIFEFKTKNYSIDPFLDTLNNMYRYVNRNRQYHNDLEALLKAQRQLSSGQSLVLIADEASNLDDISLLPKLKNPVHILLLNSREIPEPYNIADYLTVALRTKGSIHSQRDHLKDLYKKETGTTFSFAGREYEIVDYGSGRRVTPK